MPTPSRLLFIDLKGTTLSPDERQLLASRRFGGVCLFGQNIRDRFQLAEFVEEVRALAGEEFVVAIDQEGGGVLRLFDVPYPPPAMALGAAADVQLTERVAAAAARGLRSVGVNLNFAPVADVNVNPSNPVIADRSFGADPAAVAAHVAAFVQGLQAEGVAATVKHFPGHGDTAVDSHLALQSLDRSLHELDRQELTPFRAAVRAGAAAVMTAHILFPQLDARLPATLSPVVIKTLLRQRLGYDGLVVSDALDMKAISDHHSPSQAAVLALQAGVDVPLDIGSVNHHFGNADGVDQALAEGRLDPVAISSSLRRLEGLQRAFPAVAPAPRAAWRDGDRQLLDDAAARGLVALGAPPRLRPGEGVTVVTASGVWRNSAEQERVNPGPDLIAQLQQHGTPVSAVIFEPERLAEGAYAQGLLEQVGEGAVLYASSRRTPLEEAEVRFAHAVAAKAAGRFLHLALWNPYHAQHLPRPALLSFGFRPASLRAVVAALYGAPITGRLPFQFA